MILRTGKRHLCYLVTEKQGLSKVKKKNNGRVPSRGNEVIFNSRIYFKEPFPDCQFTCMENLQCNLKFGVFFFSSGRDKRTNPWLVARKWTILEHMERKLLHAERQIIWYGFLYQAKFSKNKNIQNRHSCGIEFADVLDPVKGEQEWR